MLANSVMENEMPTNLYELVTETFTEHNKTNEAFHTCLIQVLKKFHLWPAIQVKKFKDSDNLVLLHNTYKREDTDHFSELYEQCRSVVLDFASRDYNHVVVSYSYSIPQRITHDAYVNTSDVNVNCKYQEAYDGTMITVYNYNNTWYFGTSSCPDVNFSKFPHPTKSHGYMLNEVLMKYFRNSFTDEELNTCTEQQISQKLRALFTANLNPALAYEFVLIHHENKHIINYTSSLGQGYKELIHVNCKTRDTLTEVDLSTCPMSNIGVKYPVCFQSLEEAYSHVNTTNSYGLIAKQYTDNGVVKLFKISPNHVDIKEDTDPCNPNVWHNLLMVYMKNRKDFKINDYIKTYNPNLQLPLDDKGRPMDPTYLIHTMISTLKDVLYNLYITTTTYNSRTNRFRMNKELDKQFPPVIRFHLAQLRYRQQAYHTNALIRPKDVYYYLCHCNNVKNIKLLITLFATNVGYNIAERPALCLTILNGLL